MFENLTQREKNLAIAVACLLPIMLVFLGWMTFNSKYQAGRTRIVALDKQIKSENQKALDAISAGTRRGFYYKPVSLPTGQKSVTRYQDWLEKLIRDSGMRFSTIPRPSNSKFTFRSETGAGVSTVGKTLTFRFDATGDLDQIMKFCYEFEQIDLLHKIKQLNVKPTIDKSGGPTGECKASFGIQVLSLKDADESRDFLSPKRSLPKTLDQYEQIVLSRNIFGPANKAPTLSLSRKSFTEGDEISFPISGRDVDQDELSYELLDYGDIEGAKLVTNGNKATFEAPPLEPGDYEIKVKVSDDGLPSKSVEKICKIVVKEKKVKPIEQVAEKKPFPNAGSSMINRISRRNGVSEFKIGVRTTGEVFELKIGDEFELDDKTWLVKEIDNRRRKVVIESDGRILEFKQGDFLDKPRKVIEPANSDVVDVKANES